MEQQEDNILDKKQESSPISQDRQVPIEKTEEPSPEVQEVEVLDKEEPSQNNHTVIAHRSESFSGPIPPPDLLAQYNDIVPNAADRILTMAEQQQNHRIYMEKGVVEGDIRRSDRGLILGFIIAVLAEIGGIYLLATGHNINGLALVFGPLATLVGIFIYSQKNRQKERKERRKTISEQK